MLHLFHIITMTIFLLSCGTDPNQESLIEQAVEEQTGTSTEEVFNETESTDDIQAQDIPEDFNDTSDDYSDMGELDYPDGTEEPDDIEEEEGSEDIDEPDGTTDDNTSDPGPDGFQLYANNCQGCHGKIANSSKRNKTAAQITNAIANVGSMSQFSTLTNEEIEAISYALGD